MREFEIYKLPQGQVIISHADRDLSIGVLFLDPHQEYPRHTRPVDEQLVQLAGETLLRFYDGEEAVMEITLRGNDRFTVPAHQLHSHVSPTDSLSIVMSKFEGDISEVIASLRQNPRIG